MTPQEAVSWFISLIIILIIVMYYYFKDYTKQQKPVIKHNKLTKWNWMVSHPENLILGENTDIGAFTYIQAENGVTIGKNVQIGSHCSIYSKNTIDKTEGKIIIEDNVKISSHSVILPNSNGTPLYICHDSVIGAFSLVKHNILPNSIIVGIPAKKYIKRQYEHGL